MEGSLSQRQIADEPNCQLNFAYFMTSPGMFRISATILTLISTAIMQFGVFSRAYVFPGSVKTHSGENASDLIIKLKHNQIETNQAKDFPDRRLVLVSHDALLMMSFLSSVLLGVFFLTNAYRIWLCNLLDFIYHILTGILQFVCGAAVLLFLYQVYYWMPCSKGSLEERNACRTSRSASFQITPLIVAVAFMVMTGLVYAITAAEIKAFDSSRVHNSNHAHIFFEDEVRRKVKPSSKKIPAGIETP